MIYDDIQQAGRYFPGCGAWHTALEHLRTLSADSPDGETVLVDGRRLVAIVQTYDTRPAEACVVESHRRYIDLQVVLDGQERFDCFMPADLTIKTPYSAENDVVFYDPSAAPDPPPARVLLVPGRFAILFPTDAHRPGVMPAADVGPAVIRKVVYKIDCEIWDTPK